MMIRALGTFVAESSNFIRKSGNFRRLTKDEIRAKIAKGCAIDAMISFHEAIDARIKNYRCSFYKAMKEKMTETRKKI